MSTIQRAAILFLLTALSSLAVAGEIVDSTAALVAAVRDGAEGATIDIGPGTYELDAPLEPKAEMTLKGAGLDQTIITHAAGWKPSTKTLPDAEMKTDGMDTRSSSSATESRSATTCSISTCKTLTGT